MKPDLYIARRYLVAKKSLGVIHAISVLSAIGMAVGTAALILIPSVYNGFDQIIKQSLSDLAPDVLVTPAQGKYFVPEGPAFEALCADPRVTQVCGVVEEQVFVAYGGRQELALAKGVDAAYEQASRLAEHVVEGEFALHDGLRPQVAVGVALARKLGLRTHFLDPMTLYYPRRGARIPLAGPGAALGSVRLYPAALLSINASTDEELLVLPIAQMRSLLGLSAEQVSGLELRLSELPGSRTLREWQELLGPDYRVQDRIRQQPSLYKMMRYEKLAIYLILIFVVLIIASNIFGSLSMLSIAKREDMQTLRSLGANDRLIRRIFRYEGCLVSLCGLGAGVVIGVTLALVQQHFGIIKMPGGFFLQAYPVVLQVSDLLWTVLGVGAIGALISLLAAPRSEATQGV
ncbi:MAG: ABC transporter permease [Bacteroidales bacterium]|nr:ABC transporter permease [Bacteroidales bacterium]